MPTRSHDPEATHNLSGQRLGPKGQETRERIIQAMLRLLAAADDSPITLTAISRESSVRLSNLYLYFPDLADLLLAVLGRVIDEREAAFLQQLRERWDDAGLARQADDFVRAHIGFWRQHTRLLRMRNALADAGDGRLLAYRSVISRLPIALLARQMDAPPDDLASAHQSVATVLFTGLERVATVVTNPNFPEMAGIASDAARERFIDGLAHAQARVIEFTIRSMRAQA